MNTSQLDFLRKKIYSSLLRHYYIREQHESIFVGETGRFENRRAQTYMDMTAALNCRALSEQKHFLFIFNHLLICFVERVP